MRLAGTLLGRWPANETADIITVHCIANGLRQFDPQRLSAPPAVGAGKLARTEGQNNALPPEKAPRWWDRFGDQRLSRVVDQVLESNNDLAAAALTLKQARLSARLTDQYQPDATLSGTGSNSKPLNSGGSQETIAPHCP